jgi:hypothetical protein
MASASVMPVSPLTYCDATTSRVREAPNCARTFTFHSAQLVNEAPLYITVASRNGQDDFRYVTKRQSRAFAMADAGNHCAA